MLTSFGGQGNRSKKEKLLKDLFDALPFHSNSNKNETANVVKKLQKTKPNPWRVQNWSFHISNLILHL